MLGPYMSQSQSPTLAPVARSAETVREVTDETLDRAEAIYRERHATSDGGVSATFEIVYLFGSGPDPSQQKPLKPGRPSAAKKATVITPA